MGRCSRERHHPLAILLRPAEKRGTSGGEAVPQGAFRPRKSLSIDRSPVSVLRTNRIPRLFTIPGGGWGEKGMPISLLN